MIKLDWIKKQPIRIRWNLREVHKITQWKDGCIFKTKSLGFIICKPEYINAIQSKNIIVDSISTKISKELV